MMNQSKQPYDGSDCPLCGGIGEVSITPDGAPDAEADTYGCPVCIAGGRDEEIAQLRQELEQTSERFQRAHLLASQWQQRAEQAERQRDELLALLGDQPACAGCGGHGMIGGLLPDGGGYQSDVCQDCGGSGKEKA